MGVFCGIGSMLIGARQAGFQVIGNIEWRKYFHTGTFEYNFKNAWMVEVYKDLTEDQKKDIFGVDLVMGHSECGNFSNLRTKNIEKSLGDPGDIPFFVDIVSKIKPKFVVMDNLPRSFEAFSVVDYVEKLFDYDLFFEWISNYNYGNTQKERNRFFLIGARKDQNFVFQPGEFYHDKRMVDVIGDLPKYKNIYEINHVHFLENKYLRGWSGHNFDKFCPKGVRVTLREFKEKIKNYPLKRNFVYYNLRKEKKQRIGHLKCDINHYSPVMTGGGFSRDNCFRSDTLNPLTPRERARIQGCPDDFIFQPLDLFKNNNYFKIYKQIGKFMPVEFCKYVADQIKANLKNRNFETTGDRLIKSNEYIDNAKKWYCKNVGYSNQEETCRSCWMKNGCEVLKGIEFKIN